MALEEKGMALGKRGMARRHAKRGWGKHYPHNDHYFKLLWNGSRYWVTMVVCKTEVKLIE